MSLQGERVLFLVSVVTLIWTEIATAATASNSSYDLASFCNQKANNTKSSIIHDFISAPLVIYNNKLSTTTTTTTTLSVSNSTYKNQLNDSSIKYCRISVATKNSSSLFLIVKFELNVTLCDNVTVLVDVGYYSTAYANDTSTLLLNQSNICDVLHKTSNSSYVIVEKPAVQLEINLVDYSRVSLKSAPAGLFGSLISSIVISAYSKPSANNSKRKKNEMKLFLLFEIKYIFKFQIFFSLSFSLKINYSSLCWRSIQMCQHIIIFSRDQVGVLAAFVRVRRSALLSRWLGRVVRKML
jgi:hypothetical protein